MRCSDEHQAQTNAPVPTYAQVVGVVNKAAGAGDHLIAAAGGIPGEVAKGWKVKQRNTFDLEFGFSCMGYEVAGGWGNAMATGATPIVMVGDGSYLMLNAELYSTVLTGHKMIVVICDNAGYAVINRLQEFKGTPGFNNLFKDCRRASTGDPPLVDFAAARGVHGGPRAPLREPCRPRGRARVGQGDREDDGALDRHGGLHLDAGGCGLGRRRARGLGARDGAGRARGSRRHPGEAARGSVRDAGSEAGHRAHRLVERRSGGAIRRREP